MNNLPKWLLYCALVILFILHNDLWFWNDPELVMGLPVGLFYHVAYCLVAAVLFALMIKFAWPKHLEPQMQEESKS